MPCAVLAFPLLAWRLLVESSQCSAKHLLNSRQPCPLSSQVRHSQHSQAAAVGHQGKSKGKDRAGQ